MHNASAVVHNEQLVIEAHALSVIEQIFQSPQKALCMKMSFIVQNQV